MRNPVDDGVKLSNHRQVQANIAVWLLLVLCSMLFFAALARAQVDTTNAAADAAELAKIPVDVNALLATDPAAVPTPPPAQLATQAPVGTLPPVMSAPAIPAGTLSPICPNDGVTDASACLQAAVNQGNIALPQGTYLAHGVFPPSGRWIGGVNNLVTIKDPLATRNSNDSALVLDHVSNVTIANLTFIGGGDPVTPQADKAISGEFVFPIELRGGSHDNSITGNRFQGCSGDACIELYGARLTDANNHNVITNNTFSGCLAYAVAIVDGNDNQVTNNWLTACSLGSEMDAGCHQTNAGNQYTGNVMKVGNLQPRFLGGEIGRHPPLITGGSATKCHYANIVANNTLDSAIRIIPSH